MKTDMHFESNKDLKDEDLINIVYKVLNGGILKNVHNSMNNFYNSIENILSVFNNVPVEEYISDPKSKTKYFRYTLTLRDPILEKPRAEGKEGKLLYPNECRAKGIQYVGKLYMTIECEYTISFNDKKEKKDKFILERREIGLLPIMVRSMYCNTYKKSPDELRALGEDPNDEGGYFLLGDGGAWAIVPSENIKLNMLHMFYKPTPEELARGYILSKVGDLYGNSYECDISLRNDGSMMLVFKYIKQIKTELPVFYMLSVMGMTTQKEISEAILSNVSAASKTEAALMLKNAFLHKDPEWPNFKLMSRTQILNKIAIISSEKDKELLKKAETDETIMQHLNSQVTRILDNYILPHIGTSENDRLRKAYHLCLYIAHLIDVALLNMQGSDRDSVESKAFHDAGSTMSKTLKTAMNIIVLSIKNSIETKIKSENASSNEIATEMKKLISTANNSASSKFSKITIKSITSAGSDVLEKGKGRNGIVISNRISAQNIPWKNVRHTTNAATSISGSTKSLNQKKSSRATERRSVVQTALGYIDPFGSKETGPRIGIDKVLALLTFLTLAFNSTLLKLFLIADEESVIPFEKGLNHPRRDRLALLFVNGDWIGFTEKPWALREKYVNYRRQNKFPAIMNREVTIAWNSQTNEVHFRTEFGRLAKPYIIVYNNLKEYNEAAARGEHIEFRQWVSITRKTLFDLANGVIDLDYLFENQIMELLTPEEMNNCYVAESVEAFMENNKERTRPYTHIEISATVLGLVTASAEFLNFTGPGRIVIYYNQAKQDSGLPMSNWDKWPIRNLFIQPHLYKKAIRTIPDAVLDERGPTGSTVFVAIMSAGNNQEDSCKVKRQAIQRGAFGGYIINTEKVLKVPEIRIGNPENIHENLIYNRKSATAYSKIGAEGYVLPGTVIEPGDVLVYQIKTSTDPGTRRPVYTDVSIIHQQQYISYVADVIPTQTSLKIVLISDRALGEGDKLSTRGGNKSIVSTIMEESEMPFVFCPKRKDGTRDFRHGQVPDVILNPHCIPTRMNIGLLTSCVLGLLAAKLGCGFNANAYSRIDLNTVAEVLQENGFEDLGVLPMYDGKTGIKFQAKIFAANLNIMRLLKLVVDDKKAVGPKSAAINSITRQPKRGGKTGGNRIGEMEFRILAANGATSTMQQIHEASDKFMMPYCINCGGTNVIINEEKNKYNCKICQDAAKLAYFPSSFGTNLLVKRLEAVSIETRFGPKPGKFINAKK